MRCDVQFAPGFGYACNQGVQYATAALVATLQTVLGTVVLNLAVPLYLMFHILLVCN